LLAKLYQLTSMKGQTDIIDIKTLEKLWFKGLAFGLVNKITVSNSSKGSLLMPCSCFALLMCC